MNAFLSPCPVSGRGIIIAMITGASIITAAALAAAPVKAEDLVVNYDQSQLLHLQRPVAEIIIGNPTIADVSVQAGNLLVVTGKTFGITNIIALDAERNIIEERRVLVKRDEVKVVNLLRGANRQSYNCTPQCNPSVTVGDEVAYFDAISKAAQSKMNLSERGTDSNTQTNNQ
jgi:Flp pilus assembly secretin CpaC